MNPGVPPAVFAITVELTEGATQSAAAAKVSAEFDVVAPNPANVGPAPRPMNKLREDARPRATIALERRITKGLQARRAPDPRQQIDPKEDRRDDQHGDGAAPASNPEDRVADLRNPQHHPPHPAVRPDQPA